LDRTNGALAADWSADVDRVHLDEGRGGIEFCFYARDVHARCWR